jgi:phosphoglycolate phosphatase-like HAD superfamily hydrolase
VDQVSGPLLDVALGRASICDFDGTITHLPVPWPELRRELGVPFIESLWDTPSEGAWDRITAAELAAAQHAVPVAVVASALAGVADIAVLTNNSESSVSCFLARFPDLERRTRAVVGRETLQGSKRSWDVFLRGFDACRRALPPHAAITYLGDADYEIEFARRAGAIPVRAPQIDAATERL